MIYCKIDVEKKISELKKEKQDAPMSQEPVLPKTEIKLADIEEELAKNKKLIEITSGGEHGDGDSGSDDEPSEDNMEEDELAQVVPLPPKKEEPEPPKPEKKPEKKPEPPKKDEKAASAQQKSRPVVRP